MTGAPLGAATGSGGRAEITLEQAAGRLGVHYMTAYRYIRHGRLAAERRGGRWFVDEAALERLVGTAPAGSGPDPAPQPGRWPDRSRRLLERLVVGDDLAAWEIVQSGLTGGDAADAYIHLLSPALRELGQQWNEGRLTIADEHRGTVVALGLVARLSTALRRRGRRRPGTVVLAGVEGDQHQIPLLMVAHLIEAEGFSVSNLGADVPTDSLVAEVMGIDNLVAVGLSLADGGRMNVLASAVGRLRQAVPGVPVLIGGPAIASSEEAAALGADGWAADGRAAAVLVCTLGKAP